MPYFPYERQEKGTVFHRDFICRENGNLAWKKVRQQGRRIPAVEKIPHKKGIPIHPDQTVPRAIPADSQENLRGYLPLEKCADPFPVAVALPPPRGGRLWKGSRLLLGAKKSRLGSSRRIVPNHLLIIAAV